MKLREEQKAERQRKQLVNILTLSKCQNIHVSAYNQDQAAADGLHLFLHSPDQEHKFWTMDLGTHEAKGTRKAGKRGSWKAKTSSWRSKAQGSYGTVINEYGLQGKIHAWIRGLSYKCTSSMTKMINRFRLLVHMNVKEKEHSTKSEKRRSWPSAEKLWILTTWGARNSLINCTKYMIGESVVISSRGPSTGPQRTSYCPWQTTKS